MRTIDDYLDLAIARHDLPSNRQLSIKLELSPVAISRYRQKKEWPSDDTMLRLAALADVPESEALMELNYWRTKSPAARSTYERIAALLNGAAATGALLLVLFTPASSHAERMVYSAPAALSDYILCVFLSLLRRRRGAVTTPLSSL